MNELLALMRSPRRGAAAVLATGRLSIAVGLVILATAVAAASAARYANDFPVSSFLFGDTRSPLVTTLIEQLGRDRAAIIGYLIEQVWTAVIVVTAFSPLVVWILGSTAIHAAARLDGMRRRFTPLFVVFGYATAVTRIPADAAGALLGSGSPIASVIGTVSLVWLGVIAWRSIELHYGLAARRAGIVLAIAIVLFYLVPLVLIIAAVVAILIAAIVLDYVPGL